MHACMQWCEEVNTLIWYCNSPNVYQMNWRRELDMKMSQHRLWRQGSSTTSSRQLCIDHKHCSFCGSLHCSLQGRCGLPLARKTRRLLHLLQGKALPGHGKCLPGRQCQGEAAPLGRRWKSQALGQLRLIHWPEHVSCQSTVQWPEMKMWTPGHTQHHT